MNRRIARNKRGSCGTFLIVLVILAIIGGISNCSKKSDKKDTRTSKSESINQSSSTSSKSAVTSSSASSSDMENDAVTSTSSDDTKENTLYEYDDGVNALLEKYNEQNPNDEIKKGDFEKYKSIDNHAVGYKGNLKIDIRWGSEVSVYALNPYGGKTAPLSETKKESLKWIQALYPDASKDDINKAWDEMINTDSTKVTSSVLSGLSFEVSYDAEHHKLIGWIVIRKSE